MLQDCQGSICMKIGWKQCFLTVPKDGSSKGVDKGKLCFVACSSKKIFLPYSQVYVKDDEYTSEPFLQE